MIKHNKIKSPLFLRTSKVGKQSCQLDVNNLFWKWNWALYFYLFAYLIGVTWSTILYHLALSNQLGTSILNCAWNMKSEWTDMKCLPNKGALHSVQMSAQRLFDWLLGRMIFTIYCYALYVSPFTTSNMETSVITSNVCQKIVDF